MKILIQTDGMLDTSLDETIEKLYPQYKIISLSNAAREFALAATTEDKLDMNVLVAGYIEGCKVSDLITELYRDMRHTIVVGMPLDCTPFDMVVHYKTPEDMPMKIYKMAVKIAEKNFHTPEHTFATEGNLLLFLRGLLCD